MQNKIRTTATKKGNVNGYKSDPTPNFPVLFSYSIAEVNFV